MDSTKTAQKDREQFYDDYDSLSEEQSLYKLPSAKNKNHYVSVRVRRQKSKRNKLFFNQSTWTLQENILYKEFLNENQNLFERDQNRVRKLIKINVLMSQYVKTRSADQCRSHHQKMKKNHPSVQSIIQYIENLENGIVEDKINRAEEPMPEQELFQTEIPQPPLETLVDIKPLHENQEIWQFVENHVWYDYSQL